MSSDHLLAWAQARCATWSLGADQDADHAVLLRARADTATHSAHAALLRQWADEHDRRAGRRRSDVAALTALLDAVEPYLEERACP